MKLAAEVLHHDVGTCFNVYLNDDTRLQRQSSLWLDYVDTSRSIEIFFSEQFDFFGVAFIGSYNSCYCTNMANEEKGVFSLSKLAFNACHFTEQYEYNNKEVPLIDIQVCCKLLLEIVKLNSEDGRFNPNADRMSMFDKVKSICSNRRFEYICTMAVDNGHIDCLQFAHNIGCKWDQSTCTKAAKCGFLKGLQFAHEHGCSWNESTCSEAAFSGNLDCLMYARANNCPWDESTCAQAALGGSIDCLRFAHEQGCPWDELTCIYAAISGSLECLQYAFNHGCPWLANIMCSYAAEFGHLSCLIFAHNNGCLWDELTCALAAKRGRFHVLKYLHLNGCPWDTLTYELAKNANQIRCLEYACSNGCPCPDSVDLSNR